MSMVLSVENGETIVDPSGGVLLILLKGLARPNSCFLLIEPEGSDGMTYMQAYLDRNDDFVFEYQEGSLAEHYERPESLTLDDAFEVLRLWLFADPAWRHRCPWVRQSL